MTPIIEHDEAIDAGLVGVIALSDPMAVDVDGRRYRRQRGARQLVPCSLTVAAAASSATCCWRRTC